MKKNKLAATLVLLFLCWGAVWASRHFVVLQRKPKLETRNLERSKGSPKGDLWVVEYLDYECPSCRESLPVMNNYLLTYPSRIFLQARFHPISEHRYGLRAAVYAECASRQKKFWPFHELLFEEQGLWSKAGDAEPLIHDIASRARLDIQKLDVCLSDAGTEEAVLKEKAAGESMGVKGTPTFFLNGERVTGVDALEAGLNAYFAKHGDKR